jgi:serine/threonine protein phosphatase PrpC
MPGNPNKVN